MADHGPHPVDSLTVDVKVSVLSPAMRTAMRHLANGLTNDEIAAAMGLNAQAIGMILLECGEAVGADTREELAAFAKSNL
ncbi:MAG: hypothetical protein AB7J35_09715 [Dehalococcoidia bacterium]